MGVNYGSFNDMKFCLNTGLDSPCKDCKDRTPGCHSVCKAYKEYRERVDNTNKKIRDSKSVEFSEYKNERKAATYWARKNRI